MLRLRYIGDPILRKPAEAVSAFDEKLQDTIKKMIEIMHREDGIGLAANQVGLSDQVLVVDISAVQKSEKARPFINPKILESTGHINEEEGCLSIPGIREEVPRSSEILVRYQDEKGESREERYEGLMARVLQHEIDHLNGILFVDRISPVKRNMLISQNLIPTTY